jgi:hypothetical protein
MRTEGMTYEEVYNARWKALVENMDGTLNRDQVMRELSDYSTVIDHVGKVYCHITGNQTGNPFVYPSVIIGLYEDHLQSWIKDTIRELIDRRVANPVGRLCSLTGTTCRLLLACIT